MLKVNNKDTRACNWVAKSTQKIYFAATQTHVLRRVNILRTLEIRF